MKKGKTLLIIILMLILGMQSAMADISIENIIEGSSDFMGPYYDSIAVTQRYICAYDSNNGVIQFYDLQDGAIREFSDTTTISDASFRQASALVSQGNALYSLETTYDRDDAGELTYQSSGLYQIDIDPAGELVHEFLANLNLEQFVTYQEDWGDELSGCTSLVLQGNTLYCVFSLTDGLAAIDLSDGEVEMIDTDTAYVSPHNEHSIFTIRWRSDGDLDAYAFDTQTRAEEIIAGPLSPQSIGFTCSPDGERLYWFEDDALWHVSCSDPSKQRVNDGSINTEEIIMSAALNDGNIAVLTIEQVSILRMGQETGADTTLCYVSPYEIPLSLLSGFSSDGGNTIFVRKPMEDREIISNMLTQDASIDFFIFDTIESSAYRDLFKRGYFEPLHSATLGDQILLMYAQAQAAVTRDGEILGVPIAMSAPIVQLGINEEAAARLNISIPETWDDFLDFIEGWEPVEDYALFSFDEAFDLRKRLFAILMGEYFAYVDADQGCDRYDTELFKRLLTRLENIDYDSICELSALEDVDEEHTLFTVNSTLDCVVNISNFTPLILKLDSEIMPYMYCALKIMAINPYSPNKERALAFIEYMMSTLTPLDWAHMSPQAPVPIEDDNFESNKEQMERELERYQYEYECADEIDKAPRRDALESFQKQYDEFISENRWIVTEESMALYRKCSEYFVPMYGVDLGDEQQRIAQLHELYLSGSMNVDDYLAELDRRLRMRRLEAE